MVGRDEHYINNMAEVLAADVARRNALEETNGITTPIVKEAIGARSAVGTNVQVVVLEFYAGDNAKKHHTDRYGLLKDNPPIPVLRRGYPFFVAVKFNRQVHFSRDVVYFSFTFGPSPNFAKGTQVIVPVECVEQFKANQWQARVQSENGLNITFEICSPFNTLVGEWRCRVHTTTNDDPSNKQISSLEQKFYLLFNPWLSYDSTFMKDEKLLQEYVLNDIGKVWTGVHNSFAGRPWSFGQFEINVLPTVILLLSKTGLPYHKWGNPILVSRALSAAINSNDERGLLVSNWGTNISEGTRPTDWTGSVAIYEKYARTHGTSVKYGKCWVFSACAVTAFRALGIPSRSVTNFSSAHDTDRNICVNKYMRSDGTEIVGGPLKDSHDSIWNFHVRTDLWMSRPDLTTGYSGWQTADASQKINTYPGMLECGPCPIAAIKNGEVGVNYDAPFIFAQVNADVMYYIQDSKQPLEFRRASTEKNQVGKKIVTKMPNIYDSHGISDAQDITADYKYPEGTPEERYTISRALQCMNLTSPAMSLPLLPEDISFSLEDEGKVTLGQDIKVSLIVKNTWDKPLSLYINMVANSVLYNGKISEQIKHDHETVVVESNKRDILQMTVTPKEYMDKLTDMALVKITCVAVVKETEQTWCGSLDFSLQRPVLTIQVTGKSKVGQTIQAQFSFPNPLHVTLTDCKFSAEGPGLQKPKIWSFRDVKPREMVKFNTEFKPKLSGKLTYIASFSSKELSGVTGSIIFNIQE